MEALGFYVCDTDLEHELVRALGVVAVERIIEDEGELSSFRTFQKQPKRDLGLEEQLWRFMWNRKTATRRYSSRRSTSTASRVRWTVSSGMSDARQRRRIGRSRAP